jgi:hypothetical protein
MGGGPSIPAPPPPPDPIKAALANELFYKSSLQTYLERQPDIARTDMELRRKYLPQQRALESDLAALDNRKSIEAALQNERELGPQRTLETMRRQYEMNPQAFALNRALGDQYARQFGLLYGQAPGQSVPGIISNNAGTLAMDYIGNARGRTG